jgi:hypothetical protein
VVEKNSVTQCNWSLFRSATLYLSSLDDSVATNVFETRSIPFVGAWGELDGCRLCPSTLNDPIGDSYLACAGQWGAFAAEERGDGAVANQCQRMPKKVNPEPWSTNMRCLCI